MCGCKKAKIGKAMKLKGFNVERLAAVGAGALLSKGLNGVVANVDFLKKENNRWITPAGKIAIGAFAQTQKNQYIKDAGLGFIAEGLLQAAEVFAPNMFKDPWGIAGVGVVEWKTDTGVAGYGSWADMAESHGVGGPTLGMDTAVAGIM